MNTQNPSETPEGDRNRLIPVLGLFSATMIVVGAVIGSGIFFKPATVAKATGGYVGLILALWIVCGLVNLCGALAMAELSAMFPHSGGNYVFLRETYGRCWAFMWAWAEFWVIRTGSIAALAVYGSMTLLGLAQKAGFDVSTDGQSPLLAAVASAMIAVLAAVNIAGTIWGGLVQNIMTIVKIGSVAFLGLLPFIAIGKEPVSNLGPPWPTEMNWDVVGGIGAAIAAIMWAYDGWGNVTVVAEEIRQPERNVPRALIWGMILLVLLYTGANLAYHLTLSSDTLAAMATTFQVSAAEVGETLLPGVGRNLILSMLLVSLFGALNANILVGPRVVYAVARDYPVFSQLGRVHPKHHTPTRAIAVMSGWAILLIWLGTNLRIDKPLPDLLTSYCIFGGSIFYFSAVLAVFVLRRTRPDAARPYRTWGYPVVPAIFIVFYVYLLASMLWGGPFESIAGLSLVVLGFIVHVLIGGKAKAAAEAIKFEKQ